jgi:hypothetical protein
MVFFFGISSNISKPGGGGEEEWIFAAYVGILPVCDLSRSTADFTSF